MMCVCEYDMLKIYPIKFTKCENVGVKLSKDNTVLFSRYLKIPHIRVLYILRYENYPVGLLRIYYGSGGQSGFAMIICEQRDVNYEPCQPTTAKYLLRGSSVRNR